MKRRTFLKGLAAGSALAVASQTVLTSTASADDDDIIHHLQNRANPSTLEKKHVPAIEAPSKVQKDVWFDVKVKVGYLIEHPSKFNHWITKIELLVDNFDVAETEFETGGVCGPYATFRIKLSENAVLKARAKCNLHGEWESDPVNITVA